MLTDCPSSNWQNVAPPSVDRLPPMGDRLSPPDVNRTCPPLPYCLQTIHPLTLTERRPAVGAPTLRKSNGGGRAAPPLPRSGQYTKKPVSRQTRLADNVAGHSRSWGIHGAFFVWLRFRLLLFFHSGKFTYNVLDRRFHKAWCPELAPNVPRVSFHQSFQ